VTRFLSISDIRARWSCGRTFVYGAIAEMERGGYLRRIHLGSVQRIALGSVEQWEALHTRVPDEGPHPLMRPKRLPRRAAVARPAASMSIVEAWRAAERRASAA